MAKLTKAQRAFMVELVVACDPGTVVEFCDLDYAWRTATSLAKRGLCEITSNRSEFGYFEATATPAGRTALREGE